jgi:NAD(P)-dependent dehydrogenase (short-subunit alcohol dehydrogenase family)
MIDPSQPAGGTVLSVCVMNIDLTGQTAVVTGAGRGIGLAVTRARTASGAPVIAGTRPSCAAEGTVTKVPDTAV